jgi:hypothetical protein
MAIFKNNFVIFSNKQPRKMITKIMQFSESVIILFFVAAYVLLIFLHYNYQPMNNIKKN